MVFPVFRGSLRGPRERLSLIASLEEGVRGTSEKENVVYARNLLERELV